MLPTSFYFGLHHNVSRIYEKHILKPVVTTILSACSYLNFELEWVWYLGRLSNTHLANQPAYFRRPTVRITKYIGDRIWRAIRTIDSLLVYIDYILDQPMPTVCLVPRWSTKVAFAFQATLGIYGSSSTHPIPKFGHCSVVMSFDDNDPNCIARRSPELIAQTLILPACPLGWIIRSLARRRTTSIFSVGMSMNIVLHRPPYKAHPSFSALQ